MPNPIGGSMIGKEGDGYARITAHYSPVNISYTPTHPTTGLVLVTITPNETGNLIFTTSGWETTDHITYTKSYAHNFTGELLTFVNDKGNPQKTLLNITRIMPETTITYAPNSSETTTEPVLATLHFNTS
jgi:hypothetical protein